MSATFVTPPVPDKPRSLRRLSSDALRRPGGKKALSVLSIVLAIGGVGMFAYPFATDLWQSRIQHRLRTQFDDPDFVAAYKLRQIKVGQGLTRLRIPSQNVDVLVVEGTTPAALKAGAGHYIDTPLPGEVGNVSIAGHRTTFGRPLARMDELGPGDKVLLETPFQIFTYTAVDSFDSFDGGPTANPHPVTPDNFRVVAPPSDPKARWLTLTTCHPKGSARQRLILRLSLTGVKDKPLPKSSA